MTTRPSRANATSLLEQRVRADDELDRRRCASAASVARRSTLSARPVSAPTVTRAGASTRRSVAACCSARISVGAMNATWRPFSIATSAASSATIVLPAPTSPCSSRFIGSGCCMSSTMARVASFWPGVSVNGSTRARCGAHPIVDDRHVRLARAGQLAPAQQHAELEEEELLDDQPHLRRACESAFSAARSAVSSGKCAARSARAARRGRSSRRRIGFGQRIVDCVAASPSSASCTSVRWMRGVSVPMRS